MATKKTTTTSTSTASTTQKELHDLRVKLNEVSLNIKAGIEKNTNAAKPIKKQIAQLLTKQAK